MTIIVSRVNEDVAWTKRFENVVIYNKGEALPPTEYNSVDIPNIGGKSYAYYRYVHDNYENLPETIVYLQADIPSVLLNTLEQVLETLGDKTFLLLTQQSYQLDIKYNPNIAEVYANLFLKPLEKQTVTIATDFMFIVKKEAILTYTKDDYERVIMMLEDPLESVNKKVTEYMYSIIYE